MSMMFSDLQTLTSDILDDTSNGYFTLPVLKTRLNIALHELQKRLLMAGQQYYVLCVTTSTAQGQAAYSLPSDFMQVERLDYITSGTGASTYQYQKILAMTPNQRDLVSDTQGAPAFYYLQNNNVILKPIPDRVYTMHLEYTYFAADMANQSDVPDAPQQFHPYIAYLAARDCLVKDSRPLNSIETQLKEFEELMKQLAVERKIDGPRMIVSTEDPGWG